MGIIKTGLVVDPVSGDLIIGMRALLTTDPRTGLFIFPPEVRRIWLDIGTHARAGYTRPELDKAGGKDLFIIGFEPNRFQWGEISTIGALALPALFLRAVSSGVRIS